MSHRSIVYPRKGQPIRSFIADSDQCFGRVTMNEPTPVNENTNQGNGHGIDDGPSLHTRMAFAGAWILIAVAGVIGRIC
jgi:hypothetical protein